MLSIIFNWRCLLLESVEKSAREAAGKSRFDEYINIDWISSGGRRSSAA